MTGKDVLGFRNWLVVGDVLNKKKYAHRIVNRLKSENYVVYQLNPVKKNEGIYNDFKSLLSADAHIDIIDLVISPRIGLGILKEAAEYGIKRVLIQPGAESTEIIEFCKQNEFEFLESCILRELNNKEL